MKGLNTMTPVTIVLTVLQLLSGLAVTVIVLAQSGKSSGLSGVIAGGAETFMSKGKAKTLDAKLAKATKWFGLGFVVLTLILTVVMK
jgi:preprotein translocase subunit SecG